MLGGVGVVVAVVAAVLIGNAATDRAQERLATDFEQNRATTTTTTAGPVEDNPTISTVTTTPGEDVAGPPLGTTTTIPDLVPEVAPAEGEALGKILIPAADVDWVIVEGVSPDHLALGPGHMPGTALPGQPGNAVISGHRTTHGAPFFGLDLLQAGDEITVETLIGTHTYEVVEVFIVLPSEVWVTGPVDGSWLTLTTCHPINRSIERLIVFARLSAGPNFEAIDATFPGDWAPPERPGA